MGFVTNTGWDSDLGALYDQLEELKRHFQAGELTEEEYRRRSVELEAQIAWRGCNTLNQQKNSPKMKYKAK